MYYSSFNGMNISALGMGILRIPNVKNMKGGEEMNRRLGARIIDACFSSGINYFDTAYTYGDSELFVGDVLSKYRRDRYYLSSKYKEDCGKPIEEVFFEQLERCRTSYFDIYLLHGLNEKNIDEYMKPGYIEFLEKQRSEGRIRNIGFSSHAAPEMLEKFLENYDGWDMALIQLNRLDWDLLEARKQYGILKERNIPIFVMEPLKGAILASSGAQEAFRWLQGLEGIACVLSGMTSPAQVFENAKTFDRRNPLDEEELAEYEGKIEKIREEQLIQCTNCNYCKGKCPEGIMISTIMKAINEKKISGETWRIDGLDNAKGQVDCTGCRTCMAYCPQKLDIPEILKQNY